MPVDKTLLDQNRREINLSDENIVGGVLPENFPADYPKLTALLNSYYEFEGTDNSPNKLIEQLFAARDIVQTDIELLAFIEDELLLGQNYFQGFINKRAAAQYSSTLYRSKGTLYSIQQFFRSFFGITPDAVYTKENVFIVSESRIGAESQKYLTNDELYQTYALLIKSAIPFAEWKEAYKLFVHPAGMYIGAEIQIVSVVDNLVNNDRMPDAIPDQDTLISAVGLATIPSAGKADLTGIVNYSSADSDVRITLPQIKLDEISDETIGALNHAYDNLGEFMGTNSPTFDEDDDLNDSAAPRFDQTFDTFDEVNYNIYDSDGT